MHYYNITPDADLLRIECKNFGAEIADLVILELTVVFKDKKPNLHIYSGSI